MPADIAVLSGDPLAIAPARIAAVRVGATIVGGELVHNTGAATAR